MAPERFLSLSKDLSKECGRGSATAAEHAEAHQPNVSTKVVRIIQSYVGVVNKMVWRKF